MNQEKYKLEVDKENKIYAFKSIGPQGVITKIVQFYPVSLHETGFENVYNLGFGDYDPLTVKLNDKVNSNNGDRDIVLASVTAAALDFLGENPNFTLYAVGSTPNRTRLYQMGINRFYNEIITDYVVWELRGDATWEVFEQNINYQAFVMRRR